MLKNDKKASNIMQFSNTITYNLKNQQKTIENVPLNKGMVLLAAEKDEKIEWTPWFNQGYTYNTGSSSWGTNNVTRLKVMLSVGEFSDKIASTNLIPAESALGKTTDGGVLCQVCINASDNPTTIKFTMPKDGVVYVKWVPDTTDYDTAGWIQPLDVSKCNSYVSVTEN